MSDFYALLRQSILDRRITDAEERDAIYGQARRAMIRRLWAFDPPLEEEEIDQRINAFDVAVNDIEADVVATFSRDEAAPARSVDEEIERGLQEEFFQQSEERSQKRVPAIADQRQLAQSVRDAGLVRYREEQERVRAYQAPADPYDDPYGEAPAAPPPPERRRAREAPRMLPPAQARPAAYDPPENSYADADRAYREDHPVRPKNEAWVEKRPARKRPAEEELPRRRERRRLERRPPPKRQQRRKLTDTDKIRVLIGAIGLCLAILVATGAYVLIPRQGNSAVADLGTRREVSDAATAVRIASEELPVNQSFLVFDGRDPTVFETSPDNPVRFDSGAGTVRISSSTGSPGVKALIGPGLATRLAGHDVRVTIVARASPEAGAAGMRFAYQSGVAISHWQTANLGSDYQAVAMVWRVPALQTDRGGDLLVIQPGIPGDGTGADIKSIKIDLLSS
jgi:hypothetical protein